MLDRLRFSAYRAAIGGVTLASFRSQRVPNLVPPTSGPVSFRPFAEAFPQMPVVGLIDPDGFRADDARRLRRIDWSSRLLGVVDRLAPSRTLPVPPDQRALINALYPRTFRLAWPHPPVVPAGLPAGPGGPPTDVVAELAVAGPFASYLQVAPEEAGTGRYVLDVSWLLQYPTRAGLVRPGGTAILQQGDAGLRSVEFARGGPGRPVTGWRSRMLERDALLAGLNEDATTFRHNVAVHLATLTPFAVASANRLGVDHPVRRMLHHCFLTVLIGNREVGQLQLGGAAGFATRIFSHDHGTVAQMATDYLTRYDFWDLEPTEQFRRRGTTTTPFPYPYRDNVLELWGATRAYAEQYLRLYYDSDVAVHEDVELRAWVDDLDALLPQGLSRPGHSVGVTWLARVCATLVHLSTVEHDVLNNLTWDYSTPSWLIPTVVPRNGERMDQRRAFDLMATLIGTWKPFAMLLDAGVPTLALEERGRRVMAQWIEELGRIQQRMEERGPDPRLSYPRNLNVSISN